MHRQYYVQKVYTHIVLYQYSQALSCSYLLVCVGVQATTVCVCLLREDIYEWSQSLEGQPTFKVSVQDLIVLDS